MPSVRKTNQAQDRPPPPLQGALAGTESWRVSYGLDASWWVTEGEFKPGEPWRVKASCHDRAVAEQIAEDRNSRR